MENTIQQKLEEARSLVQRAEGALEAARQSGIDEIIQAAEHALAEASAKVASLEEQLAAEAEVAAKAAAEAEAAIESESDAVETGTSGKAEAAEAADIAGEAEKSRESEAADDADSPVEDAEPTESILSQDEPAQPKKKKTGLVIGICLGVAALLGGGYYYYANYGMPWAQASIDESVSGDVIMPDLILTDASDAETALAHLGIKTDVLFVSSEKVPAGQVTLQSVSAGQPVTGSVVLYVSMGPAPTPTPDRGPLPTPTPSPTPKPVKTKAPVIELPVETPCPTG